MSIRLIHENPVFSSAMFLIDSYRGPIVVVHEARKRAIESSDMGCECPPCIACYKFTPRASRGLDNRRPYWTKRKFVPYLRGRGLKPWGASSTKSPRRLSKVCLPPGINRHMDDRRSSVAELPSSITVAFSSNEDQSKGTSKQTKSTNLVMKFLILCSILALAAAQPAKLEVWKSASTESMLDQTKIECSQKNDEIACMKFKVLNLLDEIFRKDNFKVRYTLSSFFFQPA